MKLTGKKQYLLTVIEEVIGKDENGIVVKKCNKNVSYFDNMGLALDYLKEFGSEQEKYALNLVTTIECKK